MTDIKLTAPRWVRAAIDSQWAANDVDDDDAAEFAHELIEHLPIEAMTAAIRRDMERLGGLDRKSAALGAQIAVTASLHALTSDVGAITLFELYSNGARALDAAGAPSESLGKRLSLADRIAWLVAARQHATAERDAARQEAQELRRTIRTAVLNADDNADTGRDSAK